MAFLYNFVERVSPSSSRFGWTPIGMATGLILTKILMIIGIFKLFLKNFLF